jgi:hypothetical protein
MASALASLLAGEWEGTEHIAGSPWTTAGTARGTHTMRPATRGQTLVQDYEQRRGDEVTLTGHGVFAVEPETGAMLWWWFDDYGHPPLSPARGEVSADGALVLVKTTPRGRQRATFQVSGEHLIHRIEVALAGATDAFTMVEATYRRRRDRVAPVQVGP